MTRFPALALSLALLAAPALAEVTAVVEKDGILTDANGMTLYTFDKDSGGKSACYNDCATNWPPYTAAAGEQMPDGWTRVARDDGTEQWALNGKPLYFYFEDMASGDVNGDGKGDVWHVVPMSN